MKARLDKILADSGLGTRSSVRDLIKSGTVKVNGISEKDPGKKVDTDMDEIIVRGELIDFRDKVYYMLNKPAGVITATEDKKQTTVIDLIKDKRRRDLFPVGRLDKDTEGLLLVTNDGAFNHKLTSPAYHLKKTYYAELDQPVPSDAASVFAEGVDIGDDRLTLPAELCPLPVAERDGKRIFAAELTITEGRYHQVKRMFQAIGLKVIYLKRLSMGYLTLGQLPKGEYRPLTEEEISRLQKECETKGLLP